MEFKHQYQRPWIRRFFWLVAAWFMLWALAWLALPALLKSQLQSRGSEALGRTLTLGAVDFKPWSLELTLSDIALASADGKATQLAIKRIYVDAEIQSLWRLAPVVDAVTVEQPHLAVTHQGDGHYDFDDILERLRANPEPKPQTASAPPRFALYNLVLGEGSVDFTDHVGGAERVHVLRKLALSLPFLSSFDSQREVTVAPHLAFELNGSRFDSAAQGTPFALDAKGEASLQVAHLDIAPYLPYLPASLPVRPKAAVLDSALKVAFTKEPAQRLLVSGAFTVSDIVVDDRSGASLFKLGALQVVLKELLPLEQKLSLDTVKLTAPSVQVRRAASGWWNLPGLDGADPAAAAAAAPAAAPASAEAPGAGTASSAWQITLGTLELEDGQVRLQDDSVAPAAALSLQKLALQVHGVQLPPSEAPARWQASAQLLGAGAGKTKPARLTLQGEGTQAAGSTQLTLSDLDLQLAEPYRSKRFLPHAVGQLQAELQARWKGDAVQLQAPRLALQDFALTVPAGNSDLRARDLPSFKLLELGNLQVDLARHAASLDKLLLRQPALRLARDAEGQWMYQRWLAPEAPAASAASAGKAAAAPAGASQAAHDKAPAWTFTLGEAVVADGSVGWVDRQPAKPVFLELTQLQTRVRNVSLDGSKPVAITLATQVRGPRADPGSLRFEGSVAWAPVLAQGTVDLQQFPAQAVAPYGLSHLRLDLVRADTSFKGQLRYADLPGGPDLRLQGDASVQELSLNSAIKAANGDIQSEPLLNWKALSVPGVDLQLKPGAPMQLSLREISLADFFARLIVDAQGRLVLQDIARRDDAAPAAAPPVASSASAPQAPASAAVAAGPAADDPVIEVGGIRLLNGHVAFSDRFVKPNYSADLTELSGSLGRFRSHHPQGTVQMADLDLRGRAEGTASLEIAGKVNPLAKPLALDIRAKVRDLELSPLSTYAIKYAGYGIDRGKLSVDLGYQVSPDGQLQASNKIVLNQLVFGDAVQGASNSLPVKLAVALLADRHGVIDLDVPVSGSLNDPQFRVWPIVWKIIGNLITKALVSPFSLISAALGGSDTVDALNKVAFEPGTATISAGSLSGLDKLAQALRDKPSLRLTLVGTASLPREGQALQRSRLNELLLAEKRRQAAGEGQDVTTVQAVSDQEYPALLKAVYKRSDLKKPRNLIGLTKDLPDAEMETMLLASLPVDEDAVRALALKRSLAVREYLSAHQVPSTNLFLGVVKAVGAEGDWQPRVELSLENH